jgi:hypothetical protein
MSKKTLKGSIGRPMALDGHAMKVHWREIASGRFRPKLPSALMRGTPPVVVIPPAKPTA